jgi:salicylate hydroxylase
MPLRELCGLRTVLTVVSGVNSTAGSEIFGGIDHPPQRTRFAVYRAVVDVKQMKADPDVSWLLNRPSLNLWYVYPASHV